MAVSERLLKSISYTKTPQGFVVLAGRPQSDQASFNAKQPRVPLLVILHGINNPVNVGAILRTAEGAGVTGIVATRTTADAFSAKALRGAMGSAFRIPVWANAGYDEAIRYCERQNIGPISTDVTAAKIFTDINWRAASALVLGAESSGLSRDEVSATADVVRIPMRGSIESLNVAVAAGIILYEAARQRGFG